MPSRVADRAQRDIDTQVAKVLHDLGDPGPPLRLDLVRELLKLDRSYYSSASSGGVLSELAHKVRVGLKQVAQRPMLLAEAIRSASLKALYFPDQRRILIDADLHPMRQRWGEAHEIGHDIIPWHKFFSYGDDESTLHISFQEQIEAEANHAAARLLFLRDRFSEEAHSSDITISKLSGLAKAYGNSLTSALWRVVESCQTPAVGIVGAAAATREGGGEESARHLIQSHRFEAEFKNIAMPLLLRAIGSYLRRGHGPAGESEVALADDRGEKHIFHFESFNMKYGMLTLGRWRRKSASAIITPDPGGLGDVPF